MSDNKNSIGASVDYGQGALEFVDSLNGMKSKAAVLHAVRTALCGYGFDYFVMSDIASPFREQPHVVMLDLPPGWASHYVSSAYHKNDPVVRTCRMAVNPFEWTDAVPDPAATGNARQIMQRAADHGMRYGFTLPIHGLAGLLSCCSMSASSRPYLDPVTKPAIHLMTLYAFERARDFDRAPAVEIPNLSPREREALTWAAVGESAGGIADIMKISERTAVAHTVNATKKLDAKNKTHAVVKALRSGLISL